MGLQNKFPQPSKFSLEVGIRYGGGEEELPFLLCNKTNIFGYFNLALPSILDFCH